MTRPDGEFVLRGADGSGFSIVVGSGLERDGGTAQWLAATSEGICGTRPAIYGPEGMAQTTGPRIVLGTLPQSPSLQTALEEGRVLLGLGTPLIRERLGSRRQTLSSEELQGHLDAWRSTHHRHHYLCPEDVRDQDFLVFRPSAELLVLAGGSARGTRYAAQALADRLYMADSRLVVDGLHTEGFPILNRPAFPVRGVCTNLGGPDHLSHNQWEREWSAGGTYDYRGFIDWLVGHRVTHLNAWLFELGFGIAFPSQRYPECVNRHHPNVKREFMGDLIEYAHANDVQVSAFISFPDMFSGVIRHHPDLAAKPFDPAKLPPQEDWDEFQRTGANPRRHGFRKEFGTLCLSNPGTMLFWENYLEELFERYPGLDGMTLQVAEDMAKVCTCDQCYANHFELHWQYFRRMAEIARKGRPERLIVNCASPGDVKVLQHQHEIPNFVNLDWYVPTLSLEYGRGLPRGAWYLLHHSGKRWFELDWKQSAATLRRFGVTGLLRRTVSYRAQENDHYAFAEFAWNPDLSAEDFADRYVTRSLRRKDPITVEVYCEWIKARHYAGSLRLLQELRDQPFSSKPIDREYPRLLADSLKALSGSLETAPRSELMEGIRTAFVEQKPELLALV